MQREALLERVVDERELVRTASRTPEVCRVRVDEKAEAIRRVPLFSGLSRKELALIDRHADQVSVGPRRVLARQDRYGWEFLVVTRGRVRAECGGRTIGHLGPGDFLGESACLRSRPHAATYVTETPVELLAFPLRSLWHLLDRIPELARRMLVSLSERRD
jgi:CRP-like cAMP-binding protein